MFPALGVTGPWDMDVFRLIRISNSSSSGANMGVNFWKKRWYACIFHQSFALNKMIPTKAFGVPMKQFYMKFLV